jgi:hypothetical protein
MKLNIGKNEIEFSQEYPRCKGPRAKEIAKKLEAIGFVCWEYGGADDHYQCTIAPFCGPFGNQVLIEVYNDHCTYATKFNFQVVKDPYSDVKRAVFDGWSVKAMSYINNLDFKEEFFVDYKDWFTRKMKEKDLAIVSLNSDLEDEQALEEMQRQARLKMIVNGTFMSEYKQC